MQFVAAALPFLQMWLGYWLLHEDQNIRRKSWGFALVFSALPLARLTSATLAAGPEAFALRQLIGEWGTSWVLSIVVVLLLIVPPTIRAHDVLSHPRRGAVFLALLVWPLLANAAVISGLFDPLLRVGILAAPGPWHAPWLTVLWLLGMVLVLAATHRCLIVSEERERSWSWLSDNWLTNRLRSRQVKQL
jgi:hypothetical protein